MIVSTQIKTHKSQMNISESIAYLPCSCCGRKIHRLNTPNVRENVRDCGSDYVNGLKIGNIQA